MWKMLEVVVLKTMHTDENVEHVWDLVFAKSISHPSLLCRNIVKVTLTCVFKRSDITLSAFFLHHDSSTVH
jgi:hypothetical protein